MTSLDKARWICLRELLNNNSALIDIVNLSLVEFPGSGVLMAKVAALPYPIGMLWYDHTYDNRIAITYVHVHEELRRIGVCRRLINEVLKLWPNLDVVTMALSPYGSDKAFPKLGFFQHKRGYWMRSMNKKEAENDDN